MSGRRPGPARRLLTGGRLVTAGACAVTLVAAGCAGGVRTLSFPDPPTTAPAVASPQVTLPSNLASTREPAVGGSTTTTTVAIRPGGAALNGTVFGPGGPAAGATVQAERLVGDSEAVARATTAADGSFAIAGIKGGRYRIRAWQAPNLDLTDPQIVFLAATQTLSLSLTLQRYAGPDVQASVAPAVPVLGQTANLLVQVTNPTVGPDGVVRNPPVAGAPVTLVNGSGWLVQNGNPLDTDGNGQVLFEVACSTAGSDPLSATVDGGSPVPLQMPACSPPPTTTLPTLPFETTTTCPPAGSSTTVDPNATTTVLDFGGC